MRHSYEYCDCPYECVDKSCEWCMACCPDHAGQCGECGCNTVSGFVDDACECDCHNDTMSDVEERRSERRQMGITE